MMRNIIAISIMRRFAGVMTKKTKQNIRQVCAFNVSFICSSIYLSEFGALCQLTVLSLYCMRWHKLVWEIPIKHCCRENRRLFCEYLDTYLFIYIRVHEILNRKSEGSCQPRRECRVVNANYARDMQANSKPRGSSFIIS